MPQVKFAGKAEQTHISHREIDGVLRLFPAIYHQFCMGPQLESRPRHPCAATLAHQQLPTQRRLQRVQPRGDGRMRDIQPLGGFVEVARFQHSEECFEERQVHG
nr:hypothetical protein [Roseicyclus sp.]